MPNSGIRSSRFAVYTTGVMPEPSQWKQLRWKIGDFVGRWFSPRVGAWIEGASW